MVQVRGQSMMYKGRAIRMAAIRDISERTRAEHSRRALVAGTAGVLGEDFFRSLVRTSRRAEREVRLRGGAGRNGQIASGAERVTATGTGSVRSPARRHAVAISCCDGIRFFGDSVHDGF